MRDYNYRRNMNKKEQRRRAHLARNIGYWGAMPLARVDEDCNEYFVEGDRLGGKQEMLRRSNKILRRAGLEDIGSHSNYKKVYDLWWNID